ncbi:MAG TPA: zinc-binding alcohol dehydrogenase family protein [Acidobacteriaceae bacterium]|nr:zinc-binding alcohol dehydrogenase family protein [Acidobacteriaceae bacterium]
MNAALVESFQSPPRYTQFDDPQPQPSESLVAVLAAGLHPIVKALAKGSHYGSTGKLPFVPGLDGVGRLDDGRRVFFGASRPPFGSMAERTIARPPFLIPLPDAIPDAAAAALGNPAMSSWAALAHRAKFTAGESILVLGATGVAGQLAVQIAKRLGAARVVACGRNPEALAKTKSLGADATISLELSHDELVTALRREIDNGIDIVLDYLWGAPAEATLEAIAKKGLSHATARIRYIQIGNSAGAKIWLEASVLRSSGLELLGSGFGSASMQDLAASIADFFAEAARKPFEISVRTFPLRDVSAAWNEPDGDARFVFVP